MNVTRERRVKKIPSYCVLRILSQLFPRISLCDNAFCQTFGYEAAVTLFRNLKYEIVSRRISHEVFLVGRGRVR